MRETKSPLPVIREEQQPESVKVKTAHRVDPPAHILEEFFHRELRQFLVSDLLPTGRRIIECCLSRGTLADYEALLELRTFEQEGA